MKKIIAVLLCVFILQLTAPLSASANDIYLEGPIEVPYDITYFFFIHDYFQADTLYEVQRLLDLVRRSKKDLVLIQPTEEIYEETEQMLLAFAQTNAEACWSQGTVRDLGGILELDVSWKGFDYDQLPVLHNAQELYHAVQKSKSHPTYDKAYCISTDYLSYTEYQNSGFETIVKEVLEEYGEDISPYLLYSSTYYRSSHDSYYIFVSIGVISHYDYQEQEKTNEIRERYQKALKNSLLCPITEDMTELEKIAVLQASVGNVVSKYEVTNIANSLRAHAVGAGQCMHYASTFRDLCELYNVECLYVVGSMSGSTDSHAWNCVKYNGDWYMFDPQKLARTEVHDYAPENFELILYNSEEMKARGYIWEEEDYPVCTGENIEKDDEKYILDLEPPATVKKYEIIEPYYDETGHGPFYYEIYFDPAIGEIYAIDTNIGSDNLIMDENGFYIERETVLAIPGEIDGVKVKRIAANLCYRRTAKDRVNQYGLESHYDKVILPDDIVIGDLALQGVSTDLLIVGDNVSAGYGALPRFGSSKDKIVLGENFQYKGSMYYPGKGRLYNKAVDYYSTYTGKEMVFYYSTKADLQNDSSYPRVYFSGYGRNIVDDDPVNTLTLCKETEYIDPRLNRLNRRFVIDSENPYYTSVDGILYNKDMTKLISVPIGTKKIRIPDTVTEIGEYAFAYSMGLTEIVIPASVKTVENRAFFHMAGFETIYFEGQVPEGFQPRLCGDFKQVFRHDASERMPEVTIDGTNLRITQIPSGESPFTVFYDVQGEIMDIIKGTEIAIPIYAKAFATYCWDKKMKPLTYKLEQEL